jgi:hypothetical protein
MNQSEFNDLHASYVDALRDYVTSAELTATLLARCTPQPMSLADRLNLLLQEGAESDTHRIYWELKKHLHEAARLGYQGSN